MYAKTLCSGNVLIKLSEPEQTYIRNAASDAGLRVG